MSPQTVAALASPQGALDPDVDLEFILIGSCVHSYPVFTKLKTLICPPLETNPNTTVEKLYRYDFKEPIYNDLWPVIHRYWTTIAMMGATARQVTMWPQIWEKALFAPGAHRNETQAAKMWDTLSKIMAFPHSPWDVQSLPWLLRHPSFINWRTAAISKEAHLNVHRALEANQHCSPQVILEAAKAISSAGHIEVISFKDRVEEVFTGNKPIQGLSIPTGVTELDSDMCGGWPPDAQVLVGGFSGGGKTIASVQMGLEAIKVGVPTLMISTEIPVDAYLSRMVSNHLTIDSSMIYRWQKTNHHPKGQVINERYFPPEILDNPVKYNLLMKLKEDINTHLHIEDWRNRPGTNIEDSLVAQIQMVIDGGFTPQYILFDWLSPSTIKAGGRNSQDWLGYEKAGEAFVMALNKFNIAGVMFAQLNHFPGYEKCSRPSELHISHCKKLSHFMSFVMCISHLKTREMTPNPLATGGQSNNSPIQYWNVCKNRNFDAKAYRVHARYNVQRFDTVKVS